MRNQTVSQSRVRKMTPDQRKDIEITIMQMFPTELSFDDAQSIIGAKGEFGVGIRRAFEPFIRTKSVLFWLDEMKRFYKEVFDLDCNFSKLRAPVSREGFGWLLVVDHRVTAQTAFEKCVQRFTAWKYADRSLDVAIPTNDRSEKDGDYAIWLRDTVEADPCHKGKSANDLGREGVKGITTRERLILELWYEWKNTGRHLDIENLTLCSGSRYDDGDVPSVRWRPDARRLNVGWYYPDDRNGLLRCREVVS